MTALLPARLRRIAAALVFVVLVTGAGMTAGTPPDQQPAPRPRGAAAPRTDLYGDPLPPGAVARLGTTRLRHPGHDLLVALSPNGRTIASADGWEGVIRLWDRATGKLIRTSREETNYILQIAFSPDGTLLAVSGNAGTVRLWDTTTGRERHRLPGARFLFAPDGKTLACTTAVPVWHPQATAERKLGTLGLWDVSTGKERRGLSAVQTGLIPAAFSPDGNTLAAIDDTSIRLLDVTTGMELRRFPGSAQLDPVAFSADGTALATLALNRSEDWATLHVWEVAAGTERRQFKLHVGDRRFVSAVFGPGAKTLTTGDSYGPARVFQVATGKEVRQLANTEHGSVVPRAFSANGKLIATAAGYSGTIQLWETATGGEVPLVGGHRRSIPALAFTDNAKSVVTAGRDGTLRVWDVATGRETKQHRIVVERFDSLEFSPDGAVLATGYRDVRLWDTATGKRLRRDAEKLDGGAPFAFSPDGKILASFDSGTVALCEVATGRQIQRFSCHALCRQLAFSPDGKTLVSTSAHGPFSVWEWATGKRLYQRGEFAATKQEQGTHVAFAPAGKTLVETRYPKMHLRLWEVATGEQRLSWFTLHAGVSAFAFSPDGTVLATGDSAGTIVFWQVATGKELAQLDGEQRGITVMAWSPDGGRLVSGSSDSTALVWDVARVLREARPRSGRTHWPRDSR